MTFLARREKHQGARHWPLSHRERAGLREGLKKMHDGGAAGGLRQCLEREMIVMMNR